MDTSPAAAHAPDESDTRHQLVIGQQDRLINLAYRMLGSLADAKDAVQEGYTRWYALAPEQRDAVKAPGAWLNTVVSRICLDVLGSARVRREQYVGQWLPEPLPDSAEWPGPGADPAERITLDESIDMAFLVVLDSMTPAERVSFLLHDVFRYKFSEIADIVGRTPAACRELASSARRRIRQARPAASPPDLRSAVVGAFKRAWQAKDVASLVELLDPSATAIADGGGHVAASLAPVEGGAEIARFLVGLAERAGALDLLERTVNGQPGLVATDGGGTTAVYAFDIVDGRIKRLWVVRNPEKLHIWPKH
ncbi:RNA polymerase sigma factor SigJ [Amycolatopsis sp. SID8362]|uniref:RNA polymerase sigma factor SigJ n=1 Tax=Amycolatopsis sp. SID8362 TaxID=2690346 RepID=UPI00136B3E65|nr:RNA polymerase sigma factor SigJ [Amycolatopsis sp. SID8362]NBH01695.1 sigma-70 family RNA polymerase sigma factor [Amycolatopsis sp. SID8362]NED38396.1 sigma-70 family RNA polymerase sigma factor [Amycolatopsis sp. SID8362]